MGANNYREVTSLVTTLNWLTALRNYTSFKKNKCKFLFAWFYHIALISITSIVTFKYEVQNLMFMPYNIERIVYTFMLIAQVVGMFWISVLGLRHSKNMLALMKQFDKVDENLRKIGCKAGYRDLHRHVLLMGTLLIVNTVGLLALYVRYSIKSHIKWTVTIVNLSFMYGTSVGSVILYEFKSAVYWLGLRFKETNELLQTFLVDDHRIKNDETSDKRANSVFRQHFRLARWLSEYSIHSMPVHPANNVPSSKQETQSIKKVHLLQQIRLAHLQLCCTSKVLNQIFDAQLFSYAALILIYITVILYYIYMEYHRYLFLTKHLVFVALYALDICLNCVKIGIASYSCEYTTRQATKAVEIIHGCSVYQIDTELKDEILQFCLQISHMQLGKAKSAFFRLNYGFLRDCISFVTTYLIIIIQWSQNLQSGDLMMFDNHTEITTVANST